MTSQTFLTAHLPDEIYQTVFEFCFGNASTLASLELVSKKFNSILKEDIWKRAWFHAYPTTIGKISGDLRFALLQMEEYKKKDLDIAKKLNRDIVVVLTGTHRSGKSSIAERLVNNTFTQNYNISFNYSK
jgi:polynucleotide 5'-kinase involved in rRNA processing